MTTTYADIYNSRCIDNSPTFWVPRKLNEIKPCLFGDDTAKIMPSWNVDTALQRCVALALQLELPVGEWVGAFTNSEKNKLSPIVDTLLKTNIKDETFHYRGFTFAAEALGIDEEILSESENIGKAWEECDAHTIVKAGYAEMGVFMITLAILRLTGGTELSDLSQRVAEDEFRHVATNRGIIKDLGFNPGCPEAKVQRLIDDTLYWVVGDLNVPGDELCEDFDFNYTFLKESSDELIQKGAARRLNDLMDYQIHVLPFENENFKQYSRKINPDY